MEFFEKLKSTISTTAKSAAKKSNEIVEITKLKMAISGAEADIARLMRDIGELVYEGYKGEMEADAGEMEELCTQIDAKYAEIADAKDQLRTLKKLKQCPVCLEESDPEAAFCARCGNKF